MGPATGSVARKTVPNMKPPRIACQFVARQLSAVGQTRLNLERVAAVDGRAARDGGEELGFDLFEQAGEDLLGFDRREAVGGRRFDSGLLHRAVERFGLLVGGLTVIIRVGNPSHYEGILFAILLASLFSPMIDYVVTELNIRRRRLRLQEANHE